MNSHRRFKRVLVHGACLVALQMGTHAVLAQTVPQSSAQGTEPEVSLKPAMVFFDSKLFDARLSKELESGKDRVEIEVTGKVALSAIPARLDKWITRVGEQGTVEVREGGTRTRSLFSLIPMIFSAVQVVSEERTLDPAKNYNATIIYKRDANGDTVLDRIVFVPKKK